VEIFTGNLQNFFGDMAVRSTLALVQGDYLSGKPGNVRDLSRAFASVQVFSSTQLILA